MVSRSARTRASPIRPRTIRLPRHVDRPNRASARMASRLRGARAPFSWSSASRSTGTPRKRWQPSSTRSGADASSSNTTTWTASRPNSPW
jgi:hypothetical protein